VTVVRCDCRLYVYLTLSPSPVESGYATFRNSVLVDTAESDNVVPYVYVVNWSPVSALRAVNVDSTPSGV
jgi:hypothetical protein